MGAYVYKVTAKTVKLSNGETANVAVYAYKPYRSPSMYSENSQLHFETGCVTHDRQAAKGKRSRWVAHGDGPGVTVLHLPQAVGHYEDDYTCDQYMVEGVEVVA